ncbi:MAG: hypothetical protein GY940_18435, partial [bacterium]|nr:hypothetical protein [bacterium]
NRSKRTVPVLLYGAWGILLSRYGNSDDVVFGTTVSGREVGIKGIEDMVGLFVNTPPLRIRNRSDESIDAFLSGVHETLRARKAYEASSLVDIKEYSGISANEEMFDTIMVIENYPLDERLKLENNGLAFVSYSMVEQTHYDLTVAVELGDNIDVSFYYREALFDRDVIKRMSQHYRTILTYLLEHPHHELGAVEMLSAGEKKQLLVDFNNTDAD